MGSSSGLQRSEDLLRVLLSPEVLPLQHCGLNKAITTSFCVSQLTSLSLAPKWQIFGGTGVEEGRGPGGFGAWFLRTTWSETNHHNS